jgi:hypothetical protein
MNEAAGSAVDQRQGRRNDCMFRRAKSDLLRKSEAKDRSRLAVTGNPGSRRTVNEIIEIRHPPKSFTGDCNSKRAVGSRQLGSCRTCAFKRLPSSHDRVQHLQCGAAGTEPFNGWHRALQ